MKKLTISFLIAFALNVVWENLHSVLYVHYKGGVITEFMLLRAAFFDAVFIILLILPFFLISKLSKYSWVIIPLGITLSVLIEYWALEMSRWAYTQAMPIIPILKTGLTPTIQLGLLGYITYLLVFRKKISISI